MGVVAGAAFALFKVLAGRKGPSPLRMGGQDVATAVMPSGAEPTRRPGPDNRLVEPTMLQTEGLQREEEEPTEADQSEPDEPADDTPVPVPVAVTAVPASEDWVQPDGTTCPSSHPVKAKLTSGIFHMPGMLAYERTIPDRCYQDDAAAEADGLRKAKR